LLTIFSIPKPFLGHIGVIQRNAIRSWCELGPACEVLLFGDDQGVAEIAAELGVKHIPEVARNEFGTPLVNSLFARAERLASKRLLAYVNADIILMDDFPQAIERVPWRRFLVIGQRWDMDIAEMLDFTASDWKCRLRAEVLMRGVLHPQLGVDYFVYPRGLWGEVPPFAIGRTAWDNWLIYRARVLGARVIDATEVVMDVHQNHDHSYTSLGQKALDPQNDFLKGVEAKRNLELAGGPSHIFDIRDATWALTARGLRPKLGVVDLRRHKDRLPALLPPTGLRFRLVHPLLTLAISLCPCLHRLHPRRVARGLRRRASRLLSAFIGN